MQNNSLVRVFGILFALVSIYQLSFTFITSRIEEKAETFSKEQVSESIPNYLELRDQKAISYLDSIGNNPVYGFTSYNDAKEKELNKGLDLKGGINVILQISIRDILNGLAENSKDPVPVIEGLAWVSSGKSFLSQEIDKSVITTINKKFFILII